MRNACTFLSPWQLGRTVWSAATSGLCGERCHLGAQAVGSSWLTRQAFFPQVINWEATRTGYCNKWWDSLHQPWVMMTWVTIWRRFPWRVSPAPPPPPRGLWEINFGGVNSMRSRVSFVTVAQLSLFWLLYIPSLKLPQPVFSFLSLSWMWIVNP